LPHWKVTLVETGQAIQPGCRVAPVARYIGGERFMLTYGDGVANINLHQLVAIYAAHGKIATMKPLRGPAPIAVSFPLTERAITGVFVARKTRSSPTRADALSVSLFRTGRTISRATCASARALQQLNRKSHYDCR
jgi:NDP-sugar pyrophosphorylase family protein